LAIQLSERASLTRREFEVMAGELGARVMEYLVIENSDWAYKMWFGTCRFWWDAATSSFVEETRPEMLKFI
jgi:hypothetical protein